METDVLDSVAQSLRAGTGCLLVVSTLGDSQAPDSPGELKWFTCQFLSKDQCFWESIEGSVFLIISFLMLESMKKWFLCRECHWLWDWPGAPLASRGGWSPHLLQVIYYLTPHNAWGYDGVIAVLIVNAEILSTVITHRYCHHHSLITFIINPNTFTGVPATTTIITTTANQHYRDVVSSSYISSWYPINFYYYPPHHNKH